MVETDSWRFHGGSVTFEDDHARDVDLRRRGYAVHRFTERQIREEAEVVAADLAAALAPTGQASAGSGSGAPCSKLSSGSARSSQEGIHQFQSPEQLHRRRDQDQPDQGRVEGDRDRGAEAELLDRGDPGQDEDGEHRRS